MAATSKQSKRKTVQSKKKFFTYRGGARDEVPQHKQPKIHIYTRIIDLLAVGYSKSDVARTLGLSRQLVQHYCNKLEREGFIERDYRTSIIQYTVHRKAWYDYLKSIEVKEKELGHARCSIHFLKFRFPVVGVRRRLKRKHVTTRQGIGVDINNRSFIVWVPRSLVDCERGRRVVAFDKVANAAIQAFVAASALAYRLGVHLGECELIPPVHVSGEFYLDFSRGVLELERSIFGKTVPDLVPRRKLDYYL